MKSSKDKKGKGIQEEGKEGNSQAEGIKKEE